MKNVEVTGIEKSPLIKKWSNEGEIITENIVYDSINLEKEAMAEGDFKCTAI